MPTDPYAAYLTPPPQEDDPYAAYLTPPTNTTSGPLAMGPDDSLGAKAGKIAGTAAIEGAADAGPGFLGNLGQLNNYAVAGLESGVGHLLPNVFPQYNKSYGDLLSQGEQARQNNPVMRGLAAAFPTGQTIANTAANTFGTGLYTPDPNDPIAQTALATARAGIGMIGPGALGEAAQAASLGKDILSADTARKIAASLPSTVAKGAAAGAIGEGTTQQTGNPLLGAMAGAVTPEVLGASLAKIGPSLTKFGSPGAQAAADTRMYNTATDPAAALSTAKAQSTYVPGVPGAPMTLAEQTQDPGIAAAQKLLVNQPGDGEGALSPVATAVQDVQDRQNIARTGLLNSTIPADADVMAPSQQFQRLKNQAEARAAVGNAITPTASPLDESGNALRTQLAGEDENAGNLVSSLYDTVRQSDPQGQFNIFTQPAARAAQAMVKEFDPAVDVESPIAAPVMQKVAALPDVMPLTRLMKMDQTITDAMATANRTGDLGGARQLSILKGHVMDALNDAIDGQSEMDNLAVQKGQMAPGNTIAARIDQVEQNVSGRNAASGALTGTRPDAAPPSTGLNPGAGVPRPNAPRPGVSGSGPGVAQAPAGANVRPSVFRNSAGKFQAVPQNSVDPATLEMLQAAKAFHAERAQTYRQGAVGAALATNGFKGQYKALDADVAAKAFPGGDKGYEQTQNFLHAGANSPETVGTLKDIALARLRQGDEPITQKSLDTWKTKYAGSLKAIDEHSPGFSSSLDHVAGANEGAMAAAKGIPGKFIGFTHPDEAVKAIGGMIRAHDGPTQIKNLLAQVKGDPKSIGGIRAAAVEDMKEQGMNHGVLSYPKLDNYIKANRGSLEALFGKNSPEMQNFDNVLSSLKVTQDAEALGNTKGTSYTTRGLAGLLKKSSALAQKHGGSLSIGSILTLAAAEQLGTGHLAWQPFVGLVGMNGAKHFFGSMRAAGLKSVNDLYIKGFEDPEIGKAMIQRVLDKNGSPKPKLVKAALWGLSNVLRASQTLAAQQASREKRASGGRVDPKFESLVQRLMDGAEKAKKSTAYTTKPLLTIPDNIIAKALKISNRAI